MSVNLFRQRQEGQRLRSGGGLPPGQKAVGNWPVLTYGSTPHVPLEAWRLDMVGLLEEPVIFTWEQFRALPQTRMTCDIHCVTHWSRFDNEFEGVLLTELLGRVRLKPEAKHVMVHSYGGYTTNLPLEDLQRDNVLVARSHNGQPLEPDHGGPARLVVPHLYFWKSAKWVRGFQFIAEERPGFWEMYGYHISGDPWKEERYS